MIKLRIIGLGLIILFGCKTKIADFLFDASKMNRLTKYEYDYKQGKKSSVIEKSYMIMFGQTVDSMISKTLFEYNEKGLVLKEISSSKYKEKPDLKLYHYDLNDSLISEFNINSDGDTIHAIKYAYFPDGRKIIFQRDLWIKLDQSKDFKTAFENKTFDTILFTREYLYEHNMCKQVKEYDKNKKLAKEVEYEYKDSKAFKENYYSIFNNLKMFVKSKYYDYSKNKLLPEFYTLDKNNDTIDINKNTFNGKEIVYSADSYEKGNVVDKVFYQNGREIGRIGMNKQMNFKTTISTSYYDNGDIKEERSYNEKINAR